MERSGQYLQLQGPVWQSDPTNDLLPSQHPIDNTEESETQGADDWLNGIANEIGDIWLYGTPDDDPSHRHLWSQTPARLEGECTKDANALSTRKYTWTSQHGTPI
ncbi:hypothetical protein ASPCAL10223 [Aspergillus calidoustus]|uniref:Uncharacterized protein n=1 Tax=Aspergillus calidoustus TaxID=454130 RepID=A0A0U5G4R1_ASPCI|nr:hypothetical protein ASPCAL10223 [Aspergillus calidoustus]